MSYSFDCYICKGCGEIAEDYPCNYCEVTNDL